MGITKMMSLRTAVMVVLCMSAAIASDVDQVVPEVEQFNDVLPMYQEFVQGSADAVDDKKLDPYAGKNKMMFAPVNAKMPKLPAQAGNRKKFETEANAQHTSAAAAKSAHELDDVKKRGLAIVEGIMVKHAKEEQEKEKDHEVAATMNSAAALAGAFREDVASFNKNQLAVNKEVLDVKAQIQVVKGFKKQLKAAEKLETKKKKQLKVAKAKKMHAKYVMEVAAHKYKKMKTKANKLDKAAQERKAKAKSVKEYAEVAEKAMKAAKKKSGKGSKAHKKAKKAHKKAKKAHKKVAKKAVKKANKKAAAGHKCANCVVLPAAYAKSLKTRGGKGSCKDCGTWAKNGYCTSKTYSPFMAKFCKAPCHAKAPKAANCGVKK